jgi:bis(5'-nucleosyl)-tetraphosphatase (symmetrical)
MARYAIGDLQGCHDEFVELLGRIRFNEERDELWLTGDLVNRGPASLASLRRVRSMGDAVTTVLGNHDLHLLAAAFGGRTRKGDTLGEILEAPDRDALIEWLIGRPLVVHDAARRDLLVHAGLVPPWDVATALALADATTARLRADPPAFLATMYGDGPQGWSESLAGSERDRFVINVCTRMRFCTADGRLDLATKGGPGSTQPPFAPWFAHPERRHRDVRIVFGHWSTLGLHTGDGVIGLDTGCVWGGALTAVDLDDPERPAVSLACRVHRAPG